MLPMSLCLAIIYFNILNLYVTDLNNSGISSNITLATAQQMKAHAINPETLADVRPSGALSFLLLELDKADSCRRSSLIMEEVTSSRFCESVVRLRETVVEKDVLKYARGEKHNMKNKIQFRKKVYIT